MAFGDIGGVVTQLVITCMTSEEGTISIAKGDAVKLTGPYVVTNVTSADDAVFGQALADSSLNCDAIPVKVRGVCILPYTGNDPVVNGTAGITASATAGKVKAPATGNGHGINLKVDSNAQLVHVLL
jgi:hypothetical protein